MTALGYIRRSSRADDGDVSREDQEAAIRSLSERYGLPVDDVYVDWKVSGRDNRDTSDALRHRPRMRALLRRVEDGGEFIRGQ